MPSKKGRQQAARQAQIRQRARHKGRVQLTEAQLRGPSPGTTESEERPADGAAADRTAEAPPAQGVVAAPRAAPPPVSLRARREQEAIALQSGPGLRSELVRIGIVTFVVAGILVGLKLGTDLGS